MLRYAKARFVVAATPWTKHWTNDDLNK
jgi:hypothetical protein